MPPTIHIEHGKEVPLKYLTNEELLKRIRGEFLEMPGLVLTARQAERFWGLDSNRCRTLLGELIESGFLTRTRAGAFIRTDVNSPAHESFEYALAQPPAGVAG